MGGILREQPRDIVFNLCQYGMGEVWKRGAEVGGHSWRTTENAAVCFAGFFFVRAKVSDTRGPTPQSIQAVRTSGALPDPPHGSSSR